MLRDSSLWTIYIAFSAVCLNSFPCLVRCATPHDMLSADVIKALRSVTKTATMFWLAYMVGNLDRFGRMQTWTQACR